MDTRKEQIRLLLDAAWAGDVYAFTQVLIANLEVIDGKDDRYGGRTALMIASCHGRTAIVPVLLDHGAQVNIQDRGGTTALMIASSDGHTAIVQLLLDHGAQVNIQDSDGRTALMRASIYSHAETCLMLLQHGARIDIQDVNINTALMRAVQHDKFGAIKVLMENKALLLSDDAALETYSTHFSSRPPISTLVKREQNWRRR